MKSDDGLEDKPRQGRRVAPSMRLLAHQLRGENEENGLMFITYRGKDRERDVKEKQQRYRRAFVKLLKTTFELLYSFFLKPPH